jgi:glutamate/aspartate transport system permease protein
VDVPAWGWTLSVAGARWFVAWHVGALIGTCARCPTVPGWCAWAMRGSSCSATFPLLVQIFIWYHVVPRMFPLFQQVPSFLLVVFALGFFTSARIAEQVRAGVQALPRGQRYAGMAMGFTTRRPTATSSCRWPFASSCRRSPASR